MIADVTSLEKYLSENSERLGVLGQELGRALYIIGLRQHTNPSEIENILDKFNITEIKQVDWLRQAIYGFVGGLIGREELIECIEVSKQ